MPGGQGGVVILVTDGGETDGPFIRDVVDDIVKANVRVVSIAFGLKFTSHLRIKLEIIIVKI